VLGSPPFEELSSNTVVHHYTGALSWIETHYLPVASRVLLQRIRVYRYATQKPARSFGLREIRGRYIEAGRLERRVEKKQAI
jgi:hypothetical protein